MDDDLKRLVKPLESVLQAEKEDKSSGSVIYFDNLHLSPLKVSDEGLFM